MGNSPSKDGCSTSSVTGSSTSTSLDDPDPSQHSARSRLTTLQRQQQQQLSKLSINDIQSDNKKFIKNNDNNGSIPESLTNQQTLSLKDKNTKNINESSNNSNNNDNPNNYTINSEISGINGGVTFKSFEDRFKLKATSTSTVKKRADDHLSVEEKYELDIAVSMARALNISKSPPKDASDDVSSSVDSNADSCFTSNSVSSSSSTTTPPCVKETTLYPIREHSTESTPEIDTGVPITESEDVFHQELEELAHVVSNKRTKKVKESIDIDSIISKLVESGLSNKISKKFMITPNEIKYICAKSRNIFLEQPTLLELAAPVKIVGDIHGQFKDLLRIFKLCGFPPSANFLFLGDYVDRGKQSLETITLLLCLKIRYPENFFLLRGNHESASITKMYGFYDECKRRANLKVWKNIVDVFNTLPVAATIADRIFCVHGGLSPELTDLNQIKKIQRPTDIPEGGLLADLLWSDPETSSSSSSSSSTPYGSEWSDNDRGVSYCFNKKVVSKFCDYFKFDLIVRGHMVVEEGYEFYAKRKLVTIFSAPNYCGEFDNWGAVMNVNKKLMCSFELLKPASHSKKN
ncbi:hypothetical protein CANARDRAFT_28031 [[Candida] arabinofermentans NRRL YB-2248]|uniref:Serine/threonine-protein phosphatase n=1 Tax=[Candida] arabinofermentans NRRL YB-2248 TaxID=983967 RepID=A0A1E4T2M7_9ASCO|nr:hypothetical protein CANARDRAFT_28031 [[Candida] arabinofermentans NRRL YB-2248]